MLSTVIWNYITMHEHMNIQFIFLSSIYVTDTKIRNYEVHLYGDIHCIKTCFVEMCSKRDTIAWTVHCISYIYSSIIINTFLFHKMYIKYTGKITGIICIII